MDDMREVAVTIDSNGVQANLLLLIPSETRHYSVTITDKIIEKWACLTQMRYMADDVVTTREDERQRSIYINPPFIGANAIKFTWDVWD